MSESSAECGILVCHFHHELGQTIEYVHPSNAVLSNEEASCIAFNSFPDNASSQNNDSSKKDADEEKHIFDDAGEKVFCFRLPRCGQRCALCLPFSPLHQSVRAGIKSMAMSSAPSEREGLIQSGNEDSTWLYCYVMYQCSRDDDVKRGANQRAVVMYGSSPDGAIFETGIRLLGKHVINYVRQKEKEKQVKIVSMSNGKTGHKEGAAEKPTNERGNTNCENGNCDIESCLDTFLEQVSLPLLDVRPIFRVRVPFIHGKDEIGSGREKENGHSHRNVANESVRQLTLRRIPPAGEGGWMRCIGSVGPITRLCREVDIAAGMGTWIMPSKGGLYRALRGTENRMLTKLWTLWELVLVGEPLIVLSHSPEISAAAVVALAGIIQPLPALGDWRPYMTIQDPLYDSLAKKKKTCEGIILGTTNIMMVQTIPIVNVLSFGSQHPKDRLIETGNISSDTTVKMSSEKQSVSSTSSSPLNSPTSSPSASSPSASSASSSPTVFRKVSLSNSSNTLQSSQLQPKEGLRSKYQGSLRRSYSLLGNLIDADALMKTPDAYEAACMANDALLAAHFRELTVRFLEPFKAFMQTSSIKLERSHPFSQIPCLSPLSADDAMSIVEKSIRSSFKHQEFSLSLYRAFLTRDHGRRWFEHTRKNAWEKAFWRWTDGESTRECFRKLKEIGIVASATILSKLKTEIADKISLGVINEDAGMEICQHCTKKLLP